jgi:glycosyltransferase involved in cell wall biosynthesis
VVNDTPENREVAGETGLYFRAALPASLAEVLERLRQDPAEARARGAEAAARAARLYSWERVADQYAELLRRLAGR